MEIIAPYTHDLAVRQVAKTAADRRSRGVIDHNENGSWWDNTSSDGGRRKHGPGFDRDSVGSQLISSYGIRVYVEIVGPIAFAKK